MILSIVFIAVNCRLLKSWTNFNYYFFPPRLYRSSLQPSRIPCYVVFVWTLMLEQYSFLAGMLHVAVTVHHFVRAAPYVDAKSKTLSMFTYLTQAIEILPPLKTVVLDIYKY